jgi:hypothetical protein
MSWSPAHAHRLALDYVVNELPIANQSSPDAQAGPIYVVPPTDSPTSAAVICRPAATRVEKNVSTSRSAHRQRHADVRDQLAGGDQAAEPPELVASHRQQKAVRAGDPE